MKRVRRTERGRLIRRSLARRAVEGERGAAAVEFALVLPLLLALVFGIVEFGWMFNQQLTLTNAARESARYMAVHYAEGASAEAEAIAQGQMLMPEASIEIDSECEPTEPDDAPLSVEATASIDNPGLTGWFPWLGGTLTSTGRMICGG